MNKMRIISFFALVLVVLVACEKELSVEEQFEKDINLIEDYLTENSLQAERTESGLYYIINSQGTGAFPTPNSDVTVRYRGYFLDGSTFDQSVDIGVTFNLQSVIRGWTEGIPLFREGGEGILLIPSKLGYGANSVGSVPKNSVLIFDVELLEIVD